MLIIPSLRDISVDGTWVDRGCTQGPLCKSVLLMLMDRRRTYDLP
jgi:hypothetical protein